MTITTLDVRGTPWAQTPGHLGWLGDRAQRLLDFYANARNDQGGFYDLDVTARALPTGWPPASAPQTTLFQTTRMVHSYAIAHLWGDPSGAHLVDHGMKHLWEVHRDQKNGGYVWSSGATGPLDDTKQVYGHAFVLLAASTAKLAGHPDAQRLLDDIVTILDEKFWEEGPGAAAESFTADWSEGENYRGANGNMHLVEALLAAHEATGDGEFLRRAGAIANRIIAVATRANDGRIPEHYRQDWTVDLEYGQDVFRPYGSTVGHWLEWSRLLLQLWLADGRDQDWQRDAAKDLFAKANEEGWDPDRGGYYFTVDWRGVPVDRDRYWWPCTEAIAAAHWMSAHVGGDEYESAYRRAWGWARQHLMVEDGPWVHQLDDTLRSVQDPWFGVPDVYHALQATLIPTVPATGSLGAVLAAGGGSR